MNKGYKKGVVGLVLAAVLLAGTVFADSLPAAPQGSWVLDEADVLSAGTEQTVNELTAALDEACGAQIAVLTVDFTGTASTADYAADVFNSWGVGDKSKDNGVLLLLVIGGEDYYCAVGTGLEKDLTPQALDDLLWNNLETGFAKGDYDQGVTAFANAMYDELCDIYGVQPGQTGGGAATTPQQPARGFGISLWAILLTARVVLAIVSSILHPVRYVRTRWFGYSYPPRPPRPYRGWHRRPPPPPQMHGFGPGPRPGPGPGPRPGGFGGGSSRPSGPSRPANFGGFGGGSSRGAGAGRRSGGGPRPGGGAGRGSGAGRRR